MDFDSQHLQFSVDLFSKAGHEAIVAHIEGELKHLEHAKEYLAKRAKVELDYASALERINTAACKAINDNDKESPIRKAWCTYIFESENKAKLIMKFSKLLKSTTLKKLDQLIDDKRNLLEKFKSEKFRVESSYKQESDEIDRLRTTYQENAKDSETGKRKYGKVLSKDKFTNKDRSKYRYVRSTLKLHQNHNDYVLALKSGNCHRRYYNDILVPAMLNSLQYLQEEYISQWKDLLQDAVNLTNCCRKEYLTSSQAVQASVDEVKKDKEYASFITKHKQNEAPPSKFIFDPGLIKQTSSAVTADELLVNEFTLENLQHKRALLSNELENVEQQLEAKQAELEQEIFKLQAEKTRGSNEHLSFIQKEQAVAVLNWQVDDLKCSCTKLKKMFTMIESALDKHGNSQTPKFADLSAPGSSPSGPNDEIALEEESWFHGTIDRKDIPILLKKKGDYLVRESSTKPGQFVLSTRSTVDGSLTHFIIQSDDGLVRFEDQGFPSIRELLDYLVKNKVHVTKESKAVLVNAVEKPEKDKWKMCRDDIDIQEELGSGHFGNVMKGILRPSNTPVAVKSCKKNLSQAAKLKFLSEAEILKQYDHPNIVRLIGVCADREPVYIVTEFMIGGDFLSYLHKNGTKLDSKKLANFSVDAAAGMEYLESKSCIHRDLAARNCLIGAKDILKISDFGMSREVEEVYNSSNMNEIPIKWTAPEALNYFQYTTLSDVWSFGVLLWETFSYGNTPYLGMNNSEACEMVKNGYRMPAPKNTPPAVYQIMNDCWNIDPDARPRFSEILRRLKQIQEVL